MNKEIYTMFELDDKVKFFIVCYQNMVDLYKKSSSEFSVFNLHSLVKLIIEELSKNNINRNLKFFHDKLEEIKQYDNIIEQNYKYKVNELIGNMTSKKEYALILAENLLSDINNGCYAKKICDRIIKILFDKKNLEDIKEELEYLTNALIVEYLIYGYDDENLDKIMNNVFSRYIEHDKFITTNFPIPTEIAMEQIKDYIDNLTIKSRIEALKSYFEQKKHKYYYLFNISGITGDFLNIHLDNVDIYDWKISPKFDVEIKEEIKKSCPMYKCGNFDKNEVHCSICVETIDKEGIFEKIIQQLDNALDILYTHHTFECKISVNYSYYIVFDENKEIIGEGTTSKYDDDFKRQIRPLRYDSKEDINRLNIEYDNYSKYILNNFNKSSEIIKNSIRYYRKGKEASRIEDKILNYWICIENMLKINMELPSSILIKNNDDVKLKKIISIVPYLNFSRNIIGTYWLIHSYFYSRYLDNPSMMDKECANSLQFKQGEMNLIEFINNYENLEGKLSNQFDIEVYNKYLRILTEKSSLEKYICKYINDTKNTLLLSYRYRNMIVHNAQYDITFMKFYAKKLELIAIRLLNVITNEIYDGKDKVDMQDIIINKYIDEKQTIKNLMSTTLKEWFNILNNKK